MFITKIFQATCYKKKSTREEIEDEYISLDIKNCLTIPSLAKKAMENMISYEDKTLLMTSYEPVVRNFY